MSDFRPVCALQAKTVSHSGAMEMEAVKLGLLRICRTQRFHGHRGSFLVDARAVGFALRKGRTSAPSIQRGLRAVSAVSLAADLKLTFPYLPSESNPADFPSRGKLRIRSKLKHKHSKTQSAAVLSERAYRSVCRRFKI